MRPDAPVDRYDVAVIGAGVVGLASAWTLTAAGARVAVVERHQLPGTEQSTRNSGVIHSGGFVRPGTLRARLAVEGAERLYAAAAELEVRAERSGILVVATAPDDGRRLEELAAWSRANGVPDWALLDSAGAHRLEPGIGPVDQAIAWPHGGRIDPGALITALHRRLAARGTAFFFGNALSRAAIAGTDWSLELGSGTELAASGIVNAAGVGSDRVARLFGVPVPTIHPCLGEYARVVSSHRDQVRSMVYGFAPPGYPGIGVHLTRRIDGELWLGPTATYWDRPELPATPLTDLATFADEAARLLPGLTADDLAPAPPGLRAKLVPPGSGEAFGDFVLEAGRSGPPTFHAVGIESPGLTASFAIGARVGTWFEGWHGPTAPAS